MIPLRCLAVFVFLMLAASSASAQAVLSGVVLDPNGVPVEGVTIYVTNVATKSQLDFVTTAQGRFEFSGLPAGEYRVTGSGPAFNVLLEPFATVFREVRLPFGPFSEEWQVLPPGLLEAVTSQPGRPGFRCSERLLLRLNGVFQPFCNLSFMVDEFEMDDANRRRAVVAGPRIVRAPDQRYPTAVVEARLEGTVTMEARVATDGTLLGLGVLSASDPSLAEPALASALSATWEPALIRGIAVEAPVSITIQFRLQRSSPQLPTVAQSR